MPEAYQIDEAAELAALFGRQAEQVALSRLHRAVAGNDPRVIDRLLPVWMILVEAPRLEARRH